MDVHASSSQLARTLVGSEMKIKYRYVFSWDESYRSPLERLGVKYEAPEPSPIGVGIGVCHAEEGSEVWQEISDLVESWGGFFTVDTEFSKSEISGASYCVLRPTHISGYPQPEEHFGFLEQTFDLGDYCSECGSGARQKSAFRVKKTLKWGRNSFLQLNWVGGVYLMLASAWKECLAPLGVESCGVEDTQGHGLENMVQLVADARVALMMEDMSGRVCSGCSRQRYEPHTRGFFPAPVEFSGLPIFRSAEYFGSGHKSFNETIVSAKVAATIQTFGLRGVRLWPCAPAE
ncbi:hypothetical protein SAMN04487782_3552 [Stenotrophomonas maltophilia]|nr:hypothetical protein SAMN04487782_3552 [Stenotrophomonas maltophilia]